MTVHLLLAWMTGEWLKKTRNQSLSISVSHSTLA